MNKIKNPRAVLAVSIGCILLTMWAAFLVSQHSTLTFARQPDSGATWLADSSIQSTEVLKYLGCFKDQGDIQGTEGRDLDGKFTNDDKMTVKSCADTCRANGFTYAGVQFGTQCFCGNSYGKSGKADNCGMPCGGNQKEMCGGFWANSVYKVKK